MNKKQKSFVVETDALPDDYPNQMHEPFFWENLGRVVATFGFLEEALMKAIFAFTATTPYEEDEIEQAFIDWVPKLERSLSDTLGNLIDTYGKAVRDNPNTTIQNIDDLLNDLRNASKIRNTLCHGSWRPPNSKGASIPFFVNRQKIIFNTEIDNQYLSQVQKHAVSLACGVINSVTHMGWQFPGSGGPGQIILDLSAN